MKTDQDYEYLKVSCNSCAAAVTFGKTKKDGTMFYRRKDGKLDWEIYEKSGRPNETNNPAGTDHGNRDKEEGNDSLPF